MVDPVDLDEARRQFRALVADPQRKELTAGLVDAFEHDLHEAGARLLGTPVTDGADEVARMFRDLFVLAHLHEPPVPWSSGPSWEHFLAELGDEPDDDDDDDDDDVSDEELEPDDRFRAWDLAARAATAEPDARPRLVDAALDAFESIVDSPRDPGNDEGPMCTMAAVLDRPQLERAWSLAARMRAAGWLAPNATMAHLVRRAAACGKWGLVERWLPAIDDPQMRALALGFAAAWGTLATPRRPLVGPQDSHILPGRGLMEFVRGLTRVFDPEVRPPSEALVLECLRLVEDHPDDDGRDGALILLEAWHEIGPVESWRAAIDRGGAACRLHATWELASARSEPRIRQQLTELAVQRTLEAAPREATRWLGEQIELIASLPTPAARQTFVHLLTRASQGRSRPLQDLAREPVRPLLVRLGGPAAPAATLRALAEVEHLLG